MGVFALAYLAAALAALVGGKFTAATIHLFTNDADPGDGASQVDFTDAMFTGSTPKVIGTWGEAFRDLDGNVKQVAPTVQFNWTGAGPETCYGAYVMSGDMTPTFMGYARFATPVGMADALDSIVLTPAVVLGMEKFAMELKEDN